MDEERAADILEWMAPDEAADVLGDLPEEKAEELLGLMEGEEQADVAELLPYEDDTAGGLMTTQFVTLPRELTVGEALARLREMAETPNMIYYLYVVECEGSWKLDRCDRLAQSDSGRSGNASWRKLCARSFKRRIRTSRQTKWRKESPNTIFWLFR